MAEKAASEDDAEAGLPESFLDQFLRRLDQGDQEAAAPASSEYSSLTTSGTPWSFAPTPDLRSAPIASAASPYNPLAEFPWLLEEFDRAGAGDLDARDSAQRLYSSYSAPEPSPSSSSQPRRDSGSVPRYTPPLLPDASVAGAGSVTTSAGTSNTSLSSGSTSNEDESEVKKEVGGKRKKPEPDGAPEPKKPDQPKNKPRKRGGAKRLREPRYAIKTRTDVDVLDDGFKWRKYGQKAVKNSPHPRNYYRCTTPLCPVRKRVERSNEDAGLVITTYEGTHTHQTPGFPRAGGAFGERPPGLGLFQSPLGPGSPLLPLPPGFDLASLQQATALRSLRGLTPLPQPPHHDSLLRPHQFLTPPFVKQEPFQLSPHELMPRHLSFPLLNRSVPDQRPGLVLPHLLPAPGLNLSRPASSSNISSDGHEPGSSRAEQSLETLVSSSSGHPSFHDQAAGPEPPLHQHSIRSAGPSSAASLQGQAPHESEAGAMEGLLQDMVRHGGPKVSKS